MKTQILGFLLPLVAVGVVVRPAAAATIINSTSFTDLQPSGDDTITLQQYSGSTPLASITLSFSGSTSFVINATNLSYPATTENAQVNATQDVTLEISTFSATGSTTGTSDIESVPGYTDSTTGGSITMNGFTGTGSLSPQVVPSSLDSLFEGNSTVTITLVAPELDLVGTTNSGPDILYLNDTSEDTATGGTVTVSYTQVPEPLTTAGTVAAGAAGIWLKRRQKRAA